MVKITQLKVYMGNELAFSQDLAVHSDKITTEDKTIIMETIALINGDKITEVSLVSAIYGAVELGNHFEFTTAEGFTFTIN